MTSTMNTNNDLTISGPNYEHNECGNKFIYWLKQQIYKN